MCNFIACVSIPRHNDCEFLFFQSSAVESVTFIDTKCGHFSINTEKYKYAFSLGHANYEAKLDRVMILNAALGQTLYFPRISSLDTVQVEWIMA